MCEGNYIKLNRKIADWEWYDDPATKIVFLHFLLTANWQDKSWHGIEIKRGETLESLSSIAERNGLTIRNVRTAISHLIDTKSVTVRTAGKYSIYSICEYEKYQGRQGDRHEGDTKVTQKRHEGDTKVTPPKERKEREEGKKEKVLREPKGSLSQSDQKIAHGKEPEAAVEAIPLTDGTEWRPTVPEYDEYCKLFPAVDITDAFRRMRAWSIGNPTKRKTKMGVKRFVNTWLSKQQDNSRGPTRSSGSAYMDAIKNRISDVDDWLAKKEGQSNDSTGIFDFGQGNESGVCRPEIHFG